MDVLRTPDERFADLPDWPYEPTYVEVDRGDGSGQTLRVAAYEIGPADGDVVLLMHGEPSWSFLWRGVIPPLVEAGLRVVALDLVGFGRSDKPSEMADHTYARHVAWASEAVFDRLGLEGITLVCHDWGGLIGLRLVAARPERFARVVAANTGLPDGRYRMPEVWWRFHDYVVGTPDLPVGDLMGGMNATVGGMDERVRAAYDAPFPGPDFKAGPRSMPGLIPQSAEDPETPAQRQAWESLGRFDKPFLTAYSDSDPITAGVDAAMQRRIPGAAGQPHTTLAGGGHFLQEDVGPQLAQVVVDFVRSSRDA